MAMLYGVRKRKKSAERSQIKRLNRMLEQKQMFSCKQVIHTTSTEIQIVVYTTILLRMINVYVSGSDASLGKLTI